MLGASAAPERRDREPGGPDHEDPAAPVPVAERAAHEDQRREREEVAGEHPLEVGDTDAEVLADPRERDVHHRRVEHRHRARADRGDEREPSPCGREDELVRRGDVGGTRRGGVHDR